MERDPRRPEPYDSANLHSSQDARVTDRDGNPVALTYTSSLTRVTWDDQLYAACPICDTAGCEYCHQLGVIPHNCE